MLKLLEIAHYADANKAQMIFETTNLEGAWLLRMEPHHDERGFFARTWCKDEFHKHGLCDRVVQSSLSFNTHVGTLRGMHLQIMPAEEVKLVRCIRGAIFDVIVDCRPSSPTMGKWEGFYLNDENRNTLYIPAGFAHGFQTLMPQTEVLYQMNEFYNPRCSRGFHYLDPEIGIRWPKKISIVSEKDDDNNPFSVLVDELRMQAALDAPSSGRSN